MLLRNSLRRLGKRRFSTAEPSTDEKAAEVGSALWPKLKKYSFIIVPAAVFTFVSVDIINNQYHRHLMESVFPSYVELVRKYYGFEDEDANERKRIQYVNEVLAKDVNVSVLLEGGRETIELPKVSGKVSTSSLENQIREKLNKDQLTQFNGIQSIEFQDSADDAPVTDSIPVVSSELISNGQGQIILGLPFWQDSLWNDAIHTSESMKSEQMQLLKLNRPYDYPSPRIVFVRYQSVLVDFFAGLKTYREFGNNRLDIKGEQAPKKRLPVKKNISKSSENSNNIQKNQALEAIKRIEQQIVQYEYEKRVGNREIDAIEFDIQCKRKEITDIRRKYLNYFYYF